jgi:diguanylate cyclase
VCSSTTPAALRALGVRVAIDDFGTGYSPLTYLRHYPIDELKIDKSFVAKLGTETEATAIVTAVTHLAQALNLTTVAEGVESADQRAQLQLIGCELAQGFYWSGPVPADDLGSWLELDVPGPDVARHPRPGRTPTPGSLVLSSYDEQLEQGSLRL